MLLPLLLAAGCARDMEPYTPASGLVLTVRCEDPDLTKAPETGTEDGETRFNENLIRSVDFFFYRGDDPASNDDAVYHKRINLEEDPVIHTGGRWEATFTLVLRRAEAEQIFPAKNSKATVYAVVNYEGDLTSKAGGTSLDKLAATSIGTDFADTERDYIQDHFLMDGKTTVTYYESAATNASGTINVRRYAAKMTTSVSVADKPIGIPLLERRRAPGGTRAEIIRRITHNTTHNFPRIRPGAAQPITVVLFHGRRRPCLTLTDIVFA